MKVCQNKVIEYAPVLIGNTKEYIQLVIRLDNSKKSNVDRLGNKNG